MNATVDPDLLTLVQQHVNTLKTDVEQLTFEVQEDKERVSQALKDISTRVATVEHEQAVMKIESSSLSRKMDSTQVQLKSLKSQQEDMQQRVAHVEEKLNSASENRGKYSEGFIRFTLYMSVFIRTVETLSSPAQPFFFFLNECNFFPPLSYRPFGALRFLFFSTRSIKVRVGHLVQSLDTVL